MENKLIYGIDLGTTFSAIAYVNQHGTPVCINLGKEGRWTIPSAVLLDGEKRVYVGEEAIENSWKQGSRLVEFAKRDIGLQNGLTWRYRDWEYLPEEISALILRKIVSQVTFIERALPVPRDVVITHPQWFRMNQKEATKRAAVLAHLNPVATITEPNAAAIAYGVYDRAEDHNATVLVFDLGGGTFDVTLVKIEKKQFHMLASDGDTQLGGMDWDNEIVAYVKDKYKGKTQDDFNNVASPEERIMLRKKAEEAKKALSEHPETRIRVEAGGMVFPVDLTRAEFENMCRPFVERCLDRCERLLQKIDYRWDMIDEILMVGSSSKMPMVFNALREVSGKEPLIQKDPKLMVVKGAALWGQWIKEKRVDPRWGEAEDMGPAGLEVIDHPEVMGCTAHGLGVEATKNGRDIVRILIQQNASTPHVAEETFRTNIDNASAIEVRLYEGESEVPNPRNLIGKITIDDLPPRPKGQPVKVKFKIDVSGRLEVEVTDIETGRNEIKQLDTGVLQTNSEEQLIDFDTRRRHLDEISVV